MAEPATTSERNAMRSATRTLLPALLLAIAAIAAGLIAQRADAAPQITGFSLSVSSNQAGGHPDFSLQTTLDTRQTTADPTGCACVDPKEVLTQFPTGFIGNPHALPVCTLLQLSKSNCPVEAQVGVASAIVGQQPLYNMEPHPYEAGLLGFAAPLINAPIFITLSARTDSDYGLTARSAGIFHLVPLGVLQLHLWGVPGDPKHDINRWPAPQGGFGGCFPQYPIQCNPAQSFNAPVRPYLQNPTACGGALSLSMDVLYYDNSLAHSEAPWPSTTGCDQLTFNPSLSADPTTTQADTASGLDVNLKVPQTQSPTTPSPSSIRATTVTFPAGFSINPNAADGKTACTDAEGSFGTLNAAQCPEHSKVGTVSIDSSALPAPIFGAIYLGQPLPGDRYRLFLTADGFATHVKIAGTVQPDPATGQLVVSFPDLPQTTFQEFDMHFFGSERGLLATPTECGTYPVETTFVPWDEVLPNQSSTSFFSVSSGPNGTPCPANPRSFQPRVRAGSADNTAGVYSSFGLEVSREDGSQNLKGLKVTTPPGFAAKLAGVAYCPEAALARLADSSYSGRAELASPACPASSLVGSEITEVGAGSRPLNIGGRAYLAGPYKGAPISLVVVVPAVSGPYDLGNVVVRAAIHVDPATAQVTTVSDDIPHILGGVPLRMRSIRVNLDRPGFTLNPTNCNRFAVAAQVFGSEGAAAAAGLPFQVGNCASLPYGPSLKLRLTGGVNRRGHPAIHAVFKAAQNESNTKSVSVALPKGELLDNSHIDTVCTRVQFAAGACPAGSILGDAAVVTPLLDQPLTGHAYLRSSDQGLPNLVLDLDGQIDIVLVGVIDTVRGGALRVTFNGLPDAPVDSLRLDLVGGSKGLIVNSQSLCAKTKRATVRLRGQNDAVVQTTAKLSASCGSKQRRKRDSRPSGGAGR
jgi:hypothetical protein